MVGESWIVDVLLSGDLNEESMVLDFAKVKKQLKYLIDEYVDHKLLVPVEHHYTQLEHDQQTERVKVDFNRPDGRTIHLNCPAEAYAFVYAQQVSMASVSQYLQEVIATHLPENVQGIELNLRAEVITTPYYHYTHGLKKHDGNCQRIAHGHRSKVTVFEDQRESLRWQQYWADRWCDIYVGSEEDLVAASQVSFACQQADFSGHYLFAYQSSQGWFELAIPKAESELVNTDTTVECLAQYMADEQKRLVPESEFRVLAYEGVGKGAIAHA